MKKIAFTDIHSHFLFNIDDGADTIERSIEMIRQAAHLNITHLLATPHATDEITGQNSQLILERFQQVTSRVSELGIQVKLSLAAELFFNRMIMQGLDQPWATFANNKKYLLFELPLFDRPEKVGEFIFHCRLKGVTPILAHPERYIYLHDAVETLIKWYQQGCLMQMNAGSLIGQFGSEVAAFARKLLQMSFYQFIASDAHNLDSRSYEALIEAWRTAQQLISAEEINRIFFENPQKAIAGDSISQQPLNEDMLIPRWYESLTSIKKIKRMILR